MFYLYFNSFTAKRLFIRNRLQNTFDRAFKELSNDVKICEIRLQLNPIEAEEARRLRQNAVNIIWKNFQFHWWIMKNLLNKLVNIFHIKRTTSGKYIQQLLIDGRSITAGRRMSVINGPPTSSPECFILMLFSFNKSKGLIHLNSTGNAPQSNETKQKGEGSLDANLHIQNGWKWDEYSADLMRTPHPPVGGSFEYVCNFEKKKNVSLCWHFGVEIFWGRVPPVGLESI